MHVVISPQVQDSSLACAEPHKVPLHLTLQPVQVPLNGSTTFWNVSHSSLFQITSKHAESRLYPIIQVIDEDGFFFLFQVLSYSVYLWKAKKQTKNKFSYQSFFTAFLLSIELCLVYILDLILTTSVYHLATLGDS